MAAIVEVETAREQCKLKGQQRRREAEKRVGPLRDGHQTSIDSYLDGPRAFIGLKSLENPNPTPGQTTKRSIR
jgi:hypothetical protein